MRLISCVTLGCCMLLAAACKEADPPPAPASNSEPQVAEPQTSQPQPQTPQSSSPPETAASILITAPASADGSEQLQVGMGTCSGGACPIEVRLTRQGQAVDVARLEWTGTTDQVQASEPDFNLGTMDPLRAEQTARIWTLGEGEQALSVAARSVELAGRTGVLIDQVAGFDHLSRRHDLYAAFEGKLALVWSSIQPPGPYRSVVSIAPGGSAGSDQLVLMRGFQASPTQPTQLSVQTFVFEDSKRTLRSTGQPARLSAAKLGAYPTVKAAVAALASVDLMCLGAYWIVDAPQLGRKGSREVLLVVFGLDAAQAQRALERAGQCAPELKPLGIESVTLSTGI